MIRNQYETLGVEEFYKQNGGKYRNPHELIISKLVKKAISDNLIGESVLDRIYAAVLEKLLPLWDREIL